MAGAGWLEEQPEGLTTDLVMDDQPVRAVLNLKRAGLRDNHALESDLVENAQGLVYLLEGHDFVSCFVLIVIVRPCLHYISLHVQSQ